MKIRTGFSIAALLVMSTAAYAEQQTPMYRLTDSGVGDKAGWVKARDTDRGLELQVQLDGLTPGEHGFHLHQNGSCGTSTKDGATVPGGAAGPHFDPDNSGMHAGPDGHGHQGDLPHLSADDKGRVDIKLLAPRLKESTLSGRAFIVHAGGDNYADQPKPLGGGGARALCGIAGGDAGK